jgi:hypothetical protein
MRFKALVEVKIHQAFKEDLLFHSSSQLKDCPMILHLVLNWQGPSKRSHDRQEVLQKGCTLHDG